MTHHCPDPKEAGKEILPDARHSESIQSQELGLPDSPISSCECLFLTQLPPSWSYIQSAGAGSEIKPLSEAFCCPAMVPKGHLVARREKFPNSQLQPSTPCQFEAVSPLLPLPRPFFTSGKSRFYLSFCVIFSFFSNRLSISLKRKREK